MKILLLLAPIFFASCSSYQYIKISSEKVSLNDLDEFVVENDTVRIIYNFNGDNDGRFHVTVFNKSTNGLQLDLSRSALVVGGQAITFLDTQVPIQGEVNGSLSPVQSRWLNASLEATASVQPGLQFVPPQSRIVHAGPSLMKSDPLVIELKNQDLSIAQSTNEQRKGWVKLPYAVPFRVYLSFVPQGAGQATFVVDQSFMITEKYESGLPLKNDTKGNIGYLKQPDHGKSWGLTGGILLLIIIGATAG